MTEDKDISLTEGLSTLQLISLDACTRCNECLNWCPVLDITGDESLTTPEKIRVYGELVRACHGLRARLLGAPPLDPQVMDKLTEALYTCTTCGRCGRVCEVGIDTQRLWPALRAKMVELGYGPMPDQRAAPNTVRQKHNPYDQPHAERFAWLPPEVPIAARAEVGFFAGCSGCYTAQAMVAGAVRMLHAAGVEFTLFDDEWCCGFPLWILGFSDDLQELTRHNVDGLADLGVKTLVTSCPCCLDHLRHRWPLLYGGKLPLSVRHTTQVIAQAVEQGRVRFAQPLEATITYHDPCYLARAGQKIIDEPRRIIARFPAARYVELPEHGELSKCCGSGGGIRRAFTQLSIDAARALMRDAESVGADILILDCPACYERLNLAKQGWDSHLELVDLMELAASLL